MYVNSRAGNMCVRHFSALILFFSVLLACNAYINVDDEVDSDWPELFHLENYETCMGRKSAIYCMATFDILPGGNQQLFNTLQDYSKNTMEHFNRTRLHRGICLSKCRNYKNSDSIENDRTMMEECVSEVIKEQYNLSVKLSEFQYCKKSGEKMSKDIWDWIYVFIVSCLLLCNIVGSVADVIFKTDNEIVRSFSVVQNWNRLTSCNDVQPINGGSNNFSSMHGVKAMSMFLVIFSHVSLIGAMAYINNPKMIEDFHDDPAGILIYNGTIIMQTFFVLAGFLLAYNFLTFIQQQERFNLYYMLHGIFIRYVRLTPAYMIMVGFACTWAVQMGDGPMWPMFVETEKEVCRRKFLAQLFYVHNIFYGDEMCVGQSWYLAADTQLFIVGMAILMVIWRKRSLAKYILSLFFMASVLIVFYMGYFMDFKPPVLLQSPEITHALYKGSESFRLMTMSSISNLSGYLIGLIAGVWFHSMELQKQRIAESKWFVMAYWCSLPFGVLVVASGKAILLYEHCKLIVSLYAAFSRPVFAVTVTVIMVGNFQEVDSVYRRICEWRHWRILSRLTYSALLTHTFVLRIHSGLRMQTVHISIPDIMIDWMGVVVITYLLSIPLAMLVEYPFIQLQKYAFSRTTSSTSIRNKNE